MGVETALNTATSTVRAIAQNGKAEFARRKSASRGEYAPAWQWLQDACGQAQNDVSRAEAALVAAVACMASNAAATARAARARAHLQSLSRQLDVLRRAAGPPPLPTDAGRGHFVRRRVPADNSCLFHCIKYIYARSRPGATPAHLRARCVVVEMVAA